MCELLLHTLRWSPWLTLKLPWMGYPHCCTPHWWRS